MQYVSPTGMYADIDDSTQHATVYDATDRPVATLCRARVYCGKAVPCWTAYMTDGTLLRSWFHVPSYRALVRGVETALLAQLRRVA